MDRETELPLVFAFVLAVVVHVGAAAGLVALRDGEAAARPWRPPDPPDRQREPRIGDPEQNSLTANWISYEDFHELLARRSEVEQAAAQRVVEAAPVEQIPLDPTPPAPPEAPETPEGSEAAEPAELAEQAELTESREAAEAEPALAPETAPEAEVAETLPEPPSTVSPLPLDADSDIAPLLPPLAGDDAADPLHTDLEELLALTAPSPDRDDQRPPAAPSESEPDAPGSTAGQSPESPEAPAPTESAEPRPDSPQAAPGRESNPTAAPREDREAPPASRRESREVRPGEVLSHRGIRINTVHPRWSPIALRTSAPTNPVVEITFNPEGEVVEARIVSSSGYANVDGPLLASLYRWTATGEPLAAVDENFTMRIDILLVRR